MPNQTTPADDHRHDDPRSPEPHEMSSEADAEASFREKAQEYLDGSGVQELADAAANRVNETADYLRGADPTRLKADFTRLVTRNPGPAILAAVTAGFLLGRSFGRH